MIRRGIQPILAMLFVAVPAASAEDALQKAFDRARTELHRAVRDRQVAGAVHLVVRDGRALYSEVAGFSDVEGKTPFRTDSILRIYSMSKPITTVAAMTLYERGKFALDDPVARYIPAFSKATVLQKTGDSVERVAPKRPITIRDVLRHTTGYSYGDEAAVRDAYEREGLRYWGPAEMFPPRMTIEKAAEALARVPALHQPGERFTYGFNTDLLGRLIEIWSGQPLDVFLRQAVLDPLEMNDTGFSVPKDKRSRFTSCHTLKDGKFAVADKADASPFNDGFDFLSGGGGLVSTVGDYANFCQMLVDGGRFKGHGLLKEDTLKLIFTDQLNGASGSFRFGLGFAINEVKLGPDGSQRKAIQYSWGGYASTDFRVVPSERLIQIFARQQVPDTHDLADKLFEMVYGGIASSGRQAGNANWNQFRGPNGQGTAQADRIPVHFNPETHVLWKTAVPPGHSSPAIWDDRVFLTASEPTSPKTLMTLAIGRTDGKILWRRTIETETQGVFHPLNNPASSTPAADDGHVYVYLGTYGLLCYDHAGNEMWQRRIPTPESKYGMATSPIIYKDTVILALDGDNGVSRLWAINKETGKTVWEQPRPLFKAGWSTPMIFRHGSVEELVVLGSRRLTSYDPSTGEEIWWAGGFCDETVGIPVTGDGLLFAGAAALGGRGDEQLDAAVTWKTTIKEFDRNRDNQIQRDEMTEGFAFIQRPELPKDNPGYGLPVGDMDTLLRIFDHDKNGIISEQEWMDSMAGFAAMSRPSLAAIRPGATQDARKSHLAWEVQRGIPEVPSLLYCRGRLYLLRDGGLLTCLKATTGEEIFRERVGATGQYIASPIVAGDKVVVASAAGVVTVIEVGDKLNVLARNDFKEKIYATPAVVENKIYLRTVGHLYALGD